METNAVAVPKWEESSINYFVHESTATELHESFFQLASVQVKQATERAYECLEAASSDPAY